jgi:hypothetical protein
MDINWNIIVTSCFMCIAYDITELLKGRGLQTTTLFKSSFIT